MNHDEPSQVVSYFNESGHFMEKTPFEGINPGSCGVVILVYSGFIWFLSLPLNNAEVQSSIENALLASTSLRYRCQCRVSSLRGGYLLEQAWSQDTWAYHITEVGVAALDWLPVFMPKWGSDGTWNWGLCLKGWSRDAVAGVGDTQPLVFPTPGRWGHRESWWRCLFAVEKWWLFLWKILAGHFLSKKTHERSRWLIHQHAQFWKQLQELPKFVVSGCGALSWPQGLMTRILEEYDVHTGWPRNFALFLRGWNHSKTKYTHKHIQTTKVHIRIWNLELPSNQPIPKENDGGPKGHNGRM